MRRLVAVLALVAAIAGGATSAVAGAEDDVKGVVLDQLDAFRTSDFDRAYSHAAPSIQAKFPLQKFVEMVAMGYPAVMQAQNVQAGRVAVDGASGLMEVFLSDRDGTSWVALYTLESLEGGGWRITSCTLTKDSSPRA